MGSVERKKEGKLSIRLKTHGSYSLFPRFGTICQSGLDSGHYLVQIVTGVDLQTTHTQQMVNSQHHQ